MENIQTIQKKATFKELKERARKSIKGNYLKCLAVPFLVQVISLTIFFALSFGTLLIFGDDIGNGYSAQYLMNEGNFKGGLSESFGSLFYADILLLVGNIVFISPLMIGQNIFFINNFRNGGEEIKKLFAMFTFKNNTYLRSIGISLLTALYIILWGLVIVIPIIVIFSIIIIKSILTSRALDPNMIPLILGVYIICSIAFCIFILRYAFVFYLIEDDKHLKISNIMSKSVRLMKGNKIRLFLLLLSFIGWIILSVLPGVALISIVIINDMQQNIASNIIMAGIGLIVCCIGALFVSPYIRSTFAAFYDDIRKIDDENKIAKNATKVNLNIITEDKKEDKKQD